MRHGAGVALVCAGVLSRGMIPSRTFPGLSGMPWKQ